MAVTVSEYPSEYAEALDEVLQHESYAAKYGVQGAEFVGAKTVKVPDITFGSAKLNDYDRFATENAATLNYTAYTLANDKQAVFAVDAVDDIDTAAVLSNNIVSEYQRQVLIPAVDADFFKSCVASAGGASTTALTAANIKAEIRKARSQFAQKGLSGGDIYLTSTALGLLEDATNREWASEESIVDSIGNYDGFNIFEVADDTLGANIVAISGGVQTVRYVTKRAVAYLHQPGTHTQGDCWLAQLRWVYGTVAFKNKRPGIYVNKKTA